jgi:hypothetical protein
MSYLLSTLSLISCQDLESVCPACGLGFLLKKRSVKAVTMIHKKSRGSNRNRNVPDEHFSDELLRTSCDRCSTVLRLAPTICMFPDTRSSTIIGGGARGASSLLQKNGIGGGGGDNSDDEEDATGAGENETVMAPVFGEIVRTRRKQKFEFNIVSFQRTKLEEYTGNQHQGHQKKLKIKMRAHESKRKKKGAGDRNASGSHAGTRGSSGGSQFVGAASMGASTISDSIIIGDGESAFDMLNLSAYRPETPPPRMRLSVSKMSLIQGKGSTIIPAPRTLPKVYGAGKGGHLSRSRVLTRFDGVDILKL